MLIFDQSRPGRQAVIPATAPDDALSDIPGSLRRRRPAPLPEVSELQAVRHYTRLSQKNFSIDTHFYPLGSCTMKYNPRVCHRLASLPGFLARHPLAPETISQGFLACLYELPAVLAQCDLDIRATHGAAMGIAVIEPTETECKEELDAFVAAMRQIQREAEADPDWVKGAPHHRPVRRLDEVRAARDMDLAWQPVES